MEDIQCSSQNQNSKSYDEQYQNTTTNDDNSKEQVPEKRIKSIGQKAMNIKNSAGVLVAIAAVACIIIGTLTRLEQGPYTI